MFIYTLLLPSHDFGQNDLYELRVSTAEAMDTPTALVNTLQCLPSVINILIIFYNTIYY